MKFSRFTRTFGLCTIVALILVQSHPPKADAGTVGIPKPANYPNRPDTLTAKVSDFDADGKANFAICLPNTIDIWYVKYAPGPCIGSSCLFYLFGSNSDILVPGDYEIDLRTNLAVWHPQGVFSFAVDPPASPIPFPSPTPWGIPGDRPVSGDFLGTGRADYVVARNCIVASQPQLCWELSENGANNMLSRVWGLPGDILVPGDYEGDGKTDITIWRNGDWHYLTSSSNFISSSSFHWGSAGDMPLLGDFDGDGKDDFVVVRNIGGVWHWYIRHSSTALVSLYPFGLTSDTPVPADYDGDGKTDVAVHRGSTMTWYFLGSSNNQVMWDTFGLTVNDVPIPAAYVKCPTPDQLCF